MGIAETKATRYDGLYRRLLAIREEMMNIGWSGDTAPLMPEVVMLEEPLSSLRRKRDEQIVKTWDDRPKVKAS